MALTKGTKIERGYATVMDDEGVNYREIAETMTELGFKMNHSSARNHVIHVMKTFAEEFSKNMDATLSDNELTTLAKTPGFQQAIADVLHAIESQRRRGPR